MTTEQPKFTQVPNALMELIPYLPNAECRVMLVIARKTHGFHKECDVISYSQFKDATGMSRQGVIDGIEAAMKRGILKREESGFNNGYCYEVQADEVVKQLDHFKQSSNLTSQATRPQVVKQLDHQVVKQLDPQNKEINKRNKDHVAARKTRTQRPPKDDTTPAVIRTALADVCGLDLSVCSKAQVLQVNTTAKRVHLASQKKNKTPEETAETIRYVAQWFSRNDWRGKKGNRPTLSQLMDSWGAAMEARPNLNGQNGHHNPERARTTAVDLDKGF
jgi:phage replication O-like protein O